MTFDLEKARAVCKTLPKYMNGACPCKEEAEAAKMLIKALPEIRRLQEFRDRVARILKQPLTDCDDLLILGLDARICQLRRQAAEIERLRVSLIDLHAEYINTLEKNPGCSAWDLDEQSKADQRRLRKNAAHITSTEEPLIYLQVDQQAARIKELENALVEERTGAIRCESYDHCEGMYRIDLPDAMIRAQQELQAEGKIGPGSVAPPCWKITEDRVTAIDQGLRFLEWSNAKTGNVETKKRIAILKTMLEEASDKHGFER